MEVMTDAASYNGEITATTSNPARVTVRINGSEQYEVAQADATTVQASHEMEDFHLCNSCGKRRGVCPVTRESIYQELPPCRI